MELESMPVGRPLGGEGGVGTQPTRRPKGMAMGAQVIERDKLGE
jgi:hypothetical protein